jgi:serine/threonine-protein kinase
MALAVGTRIDHYEITGVIGAGGMGEVHRARDSRLQRDVAIKVLPDLLAHDVERRSRLEREAQTLAALNHPHIAQIFGTIEHPLALVMEFVDGEDLAARLARGALPLDDAIAIARQIADALEAAHEQGIVHRDLKPANVKLRTDGTVKVLDFGLAKALTPDISTPLSPHLANSPTLTSPGTQVGVILGTAAYMSPEQARGRPVDRRTDIWAFGVMLWEMITGRTLFGRESVTDTFAAILKEDAPLEALPAETPPHLRHLISRCLERDPRQRLRDIGEARVILSQPLGPTPTAPASPARSRRGRWLAWTASVAVIAALSAWLAWRFKPDTPVPLRRFELPAAIASSRSAAISPDGQRMAYITRGHLYVRPLSSVQSQDLGAVHVTTDQLFWSPDSQTIGFTAERTVRTIPAAGGPTFVVCRIPASGRVNAASWLTPATIAFNVWRDHLYSVPAAGGTPSVYAAIDPANDVDFHALTVVSPTRLLLSTHRRRDDVEVLEVLENGRRTPVAPSGSYGLVRYVPPGIVLFLRSRTNVGVWAAPFSGGSLDLSNASLIEPGANGFDASIEGTLFVRVPAPARASLVSMTGTGATTEVPGGAIERSRGSEIAISPDGKRAALFQGLQAGGHLFVRDLQTGADVPLTSDQRNEATLRRVRPLRPQWFPSGDRVLYAAGAVEAANIVWQRADGAGVARPLSSGVFGSISPDGRTLLYAIDERGLGHLRRAAILPDGSVGPPQRVFEEDPEPDVSDVAWSPDNRRLAFAAFETGGKSNLYLANFPDTKLRWLLREGATRPRFSKNPSQLFFMTGTVDAHNQPRGSLMVADLAIDGTVRIAKSSRVYEEPVEEGDGPILSGYDVSPDGRVLLWKPVPLPPEEATRGIVVQNWTAAMRR